MKPYEIPITLVEKRVGEVLPTNEEDGAFIVSFDVNVERKVKGLSPITKNFRDWEVERMKPFLEKHGFIVLFFKDGEHDSFGPLSRVAVTRHAETDKMFEVWYG